MLFDKETRYWQNDYRKGNLDDEIMPGEIKALLDGTAEKLFFTTLKIFLSSILIMIVMICIL